MDPILLIIKYLFKKKNVDNNDESISSFFSNGVSFPNFISLILNVDSIPGCKKNPTSLFQKKINNTSALQFLFQNYPKIKAFNPQCENEKDQIYLLQLILTKQCFTNDLSIILKKSNLISEKFGFHISGKKDLISLKYLSTLLNIVTNGDFPLSENLAEIVQNHKNKNLKIPLFINESSLSSENSFIFLIQIQVIFDEFSDEINQLLNDGEKSSSSQKNQENDQQIQNENIKSRRKSDEIQDKLNIVENNETKTEEKTDTKTEIPSISNLQEKNESNIQSVDENENEIKSSLKNILSNIQLDSQDLNLNDDQPKRESISLLDKLNIYESANDPSNSTESNENDDQLTINDDSESKENETLNLECIAPPTLISSIQKIKKKKRIIIHN